MKEKIGIEKLIELLNEYEPGNLPITRIEGQTIDLVISKRYGFIKWLVENDKIDRERFMNEHLDFEFFKQNYDGEGYWYECVGYYESILCCLAIQDEPIRFLCEILK